MLTEVAKVVAVEESGVWVETIRQSTCGSCSAQKACGHSLLNQISDGQRNLVKALPGSIDGDQYQVGDDVVISIPESVILKGSLIVYLLPLLMMLCGSAAVTSFAKGPSQAGAALGAIVGLGLGFVLVRWHAIRHRDDVDFQPTLVKVVRRSVDAVQLSAL